MPEKKPRGKSTTRPKPRIANPKVHFGVKWLRSVGAGSLLLGWGTLVLATGWFLPAVCFFYLGFAVAIADLWLEPDLKTKPIWRFSGIAIVIVFAAIFSRAVVFVGAPLDIVAIVTDAEYPLGTVISGIPWRPEFTELNLEFSNSTGKDYEDLNIVVRPTEAVAAIKEATGLHARFDDRNGFSGHVFDVDPTGNAKVLGLVLIATDAGYRIRCDKLPKHDGLRIVMALADIKWCPKTHPGVDPLDVARNDLEYSVRIRFDDFSSYWLGHKDGAAFALRPRVTSGNWVQVDGQYICAYRLRDISQKVQLAGMIPKMN